MLTLLLLAGPAEAGPWVKDPGHAYAKAGYVRFAADNFVDPSGELVEGAEYTGHTHHLYAEVGVLPGLQLVTNLPFVGARNEINEVIYVNRQFGDIDVGLEGGATLGEVPVSLQLLAKIPGYDTAELSQYGLVAERFPAMGDGQVDLTAMAAVGRGLSLGGFSGWVAGVVGYRHRTEAWLGDSSRPDRELVDGIPWQAQLGWSPTIADRSAGWLSLDASGIQNLVRDEVTKQWTQVGASLGAKVAGPLHLEAGFSTMVSARNSSKGSSVSAGVSFNN